MKVLLEAEDRRKRLAQVGATLLTLSLFYAGARRFPSSAPIPGGEERVTAYVQADLLRFRCKLVVDRPRQHAELT